MVYKDSEKQKQYYKKYFVTNKERYSYSKRLQYWRKKYSKLTGIKYETVKDLSLNVEQLKQCCEDLSNP